MLLNVLSKIVGIDADSERRSARFSKFVRMLPKDNLVSSGHQEIIPMPIEAAAAIILRATHSRRKAGMAIALLAWRTILRRAASIRAIPRH